MTILIIEDQPEYANLIAKYVKGLAERVLIVPTWDEAQAYIHDAVDVAWIDLGLPDSREPESTILRIAEARGKNERLVIIVATGMPDPTNRLKERALKAGVDAFSEKLEAGTQAKVISLIMLAIMQARDRTKNRKLDDLLDRATAFMESQTLTKEDIEFIN